MNIQQLRFIAELAHQDLHVSKVADMLHVSQPSVSTQVRLLEEELELTIFSRKRNRLAAVTPVGNEIIRRARRVLLELDEIRQMARAHSSDDRGTLTIAASHAQARFRLPRVLRQFVDRYPQVRVTIRPENGPNILDALREGEADIGVLSSAGDPGGDLISIPFHAYRRILLTEPGHPLLDVSRPTLDDISRYPLVMYESAQAGSEAFRILTELSARAPSVLQGTNADVVKAYVEQGLGVTILPELVFDPERDAGLRAVDASHLVPPSTTYAVLNRKHYLRGYSYAFLEILSPSITRKTVEAHTHAGLPE
ncbi:CysB family HTH-type transcriptional regulator [Pigmentiphaga soli]|uniref:CysB family HTH-type transcriptional regulator n=1 Tax=Pigmentiphaga soli TaxID=1007095 RepID=A0ABP8GEI0_9BURK